ncbi:MAG: hypothetical protein HQ521_18690 [Bacteroidetes bacterium]|nr:hypothetical protein [Bacteroidota bacterium]
MPQKVVGVIGTNGIVKNTWNKTNSEYLKAMGQNSGNLVFQFAFCRSFTSKYLLIGKDIEWNNSLIRQECDVIAIPAANFIRENFDLTPLTKFLEDINLPLIVVGLGAQASTINTKLGKVHQSIIRFLKVINERTYTIGIRGNYTASILVTAGANPQLFAAE